MPLLSKKVISNFLRSDCQRRLHIDLFPDNNTVLPNGITALQERTSLGLPPRVVRPGLQALSKAGEEWEEAKVNDLVQSFGSSSIVGNYQITQAGTYKYNETPLANIIGQSAPNVFLTQSQFEIGSSFKTALGIGGYDATYNLAYTQLRPDLIQVFGPDPNIQRQSVQPDGSLLNISGNDRRLALRVIDIKLTAEPSVPYFIEVTFYSMVLAGWLYDNNLHGQYYVLPEPTVWPGSHDASAIMKLKNELQSQGATPTLQQLFASLEEDLEIGEFGVFAPRLKRFFQQELLSALTASWRNLPWHVDNRCIGCEYLGYPWPNTTTHVDHCWPLATATDHLSQVAFISRGARGALEDHQINSVNALSQTHPTNPAYDDHHVLRATRNVVAGRAQSLTTGTATVPPQVGTSAVMPNWADLRIYITADFDIGSGITMAFGISGVWAVDRNSVPNGQHYNRFAPQVFPVNQRALSAEAKELGNLLNAIDGMMQHAQGLKANATVQVYLWDTVTYEHLVRVIGRHLASFFQNKKLKRLAWLFPPEDLVSNADLSDRRCPITIVRDVIRAVVAAPVPHYYSLLNVAREYYSSHTQSPFNLFQVPAMFEDPLSDQIPSERAHEIWSTSGGSSRHWFQQMQQLDKTVKVRLSAVENVSDRLRFDLQGTLNTTAPRIADLKPPTLPRKMADDSRLWYIFSQLNVALQRLEIQTIHAMPPYEREARFRSAVFVRRLDSQTATPIISSMGLSPTTGLVVYELNHRSSEIKVKEGDFTFALSPVGQPGFLAKRFRSYVGPAFSLPQNLLRHEYVPMERLTQVQVKAIDRDRCYIAVEFNADWWPVIQSLEASRILDLTQDVIMDPIYRDYFLDKLKATLNALGNPQSAITRANPDVSRAIGSTTRARRASSGTPKPATEVLWSADQLYQAQTPKQLSNVRNLLSQNNHDLNSSQWQAWEESLTHRLRLIWGPPGTGKSRTLRTIVLGRILDAIQTSSPCRILIAGPTYEATDNVLVDVHHTLTGQTQLATPSVQMSRLRSFARLPHPNLPANVDQITNDIALSSLCQRLQQNSGLTIVSGTPQQIHRLCLAAGNASSELFDLIIIDEASQLDVASSTLVLASLSANGSVVVAGDKMQLPPIHQAVAPEGLDYIVGPIFTYLEKRFQLPTCVLDENYRSAQSIVELAHVAGYPRSLHAYSPDLQIALQSNLPSAMNPPHGWPTDLYWTAEWSNLLNPNERIACFVYREGRASQWNHFEADAVSSISWLLAPRLGENLQNEKDSQGNILPVSNQLYSQAKFWEKGIGIVTPHRAQQALIVGKLLGVFRQSGTNGIREAVDTVERFQGQQRDIMLATFALGDPDAIANEDEFLLSLNRFNVMASRARAKLIVFISQEVVDHLSSDMDVLRGSALLKTFVESFCSNGRPMQLGYIRNGVTQLVDGMFRWR